MSDYQALGRRLWENGEGGFLEWKTQEILVDAFRAAGFDVEPFDGIPGFRARWLEAERRAETTGGPRGTSSEAATPPTGEGRIALITDMDALPLEGGYRHMCGHHQQMTALVATAQEMKSRAPELLERVDFLAFPGEEYVELDRRRKLQKAGTISRLSGKQEALARGLLGGYSAIIATHSAPLAQERVVSSTERMNGFEELKLTFRGLSAHAGAAPHLGRNAQNGAALFLQAAAFLRERFQDEEHIRIHPVLRLPPDQLVSFVPDRAVVETFVRGAAPKAIERTADELVEAARGCAHALGVEVEVAREPGYLPLDTNPKLHDLVRQTAEELGYGFDEELFGSASTDVGDISQEYPAVIVGLPGTNGHFHRPDFQVVDEELAFDFPPSFLIPYLRNVIRHLQEIHR